MSKKNEKPITVHAKDAELGIRYNDVIQSYRPDKVKTYNRLEKQLFQFECLNNISLRIQVISGKILRFRYAHKGKFGEDFSYAIDKNFKELPTKIEFFENPENFQIKTTELSCFISKTGMKIRIEDVNGELISEDEEGFHAQSSILKGLFKVKITKKAHKQESFFGLGDKSSELNLKGKKFENWNTDSFSYAAETDPLYRTIPFFYGLNHGKAYGIFMDNTYRSFFDFDAAEEGEMSFSAAGGEMNYYFIYGPDLDAVASQYIDLTGKPELPPIWALGFHQCRWSYYPESRVMEIAKEFRKREIPCDAIYLDIDYMDGFRCFTWDTSRFPNPTGMIRTLREKGFKTIVMIDPGLKVDENYEIYKEAVKKDYLCKRPDGDLMTGPVWPADCVFPDFTNPWVRKWWGHLYAEIYSKNKVAGFWNDMNEPAVFKINKKTFPEDVRHFYEGKQASHAKVHNVYGMQMSRSTYNGLKSLKPHRRPFVITRASYSGGQRYSSVWTGDNIASWEHLQIANRQCQRLSISGFSFVGSDIGGFEGTPSGELFVRWLQLGIFHPLYRVHSMGNHIDGDAETDETSIKETAENNRLDQEPWSFGEKYAQYAKYAIELRYQLLPYIYTTFWQYSTHKSPMIRSLVFFDQTDEKCLAAENEFLFGEHLLINPVTSENQTVQTTYLPKGNWYHYWSAEQYAGNQEVSTKAPVNRIPFFIKAGAVIPHYPIRQSTDQHPIDELTLHVYYKNGTETSTLYEDAGDGFEYKKGDYSLKKYLLKGSESEISLIQTKKGKYLDTYHTCNILFYGLPFEPQTCKADDEDMTLLKLKIDDHPVYAVTLGNEFNNIQLSS